MTKDDTLWALEALINELPKEKRTPVFDWAHAKPMGGVKLLREYPRIWGLVAVVFIANFAHYVYPSTFVLFADVAYGWAMEDTTGIVKLIAERGTGRLLGAHVMGYQASSIIQPVIQAMSFGLSAHEMARGQYWIHPALPEVIENALLGLR